VSTETAPSHVTLPTGSDHEEVGAIFKRDSGLRAIVAIHSTALGPSLGGARWRPYASTEDALFDVLRLSKGMSYKSAMAGLSLGGGKAVIIGDPSQMRSEALLTDYARFVDSFEGRYVTAEDVGSTQADMDFIGRFTSHVAGRSEAYGGSGDPSPVTAYGVVRAIEATAEALFGGSSLEGRHVAVNGVGKVGGVLARLCAERGARVTIADVSAPAISDVLATTKADVVDSSQIHAGECDIYAPCALGGAVNVVTLPELRCAAVCGAANNQLDTPDIEEGLEKRGITYVPDYVANAGGVINIAFEKGGYDAETALAHVGRIYETVQSLFAEASRSGDRLSVIADRMAEQRIKEAAGA
jgi:glutamate dehydrogenase/leucine dehydrogenase